MKKQELPKQFPVRRLTEKEVKDIITLIRRAEGSAPGIADCFGRLRGSTIPECRICCEYDNCGAAMKQVSEFKANMPVMRVPRKWRSTRRPTKSGRTVVAS